MAIILVFQSNVEAPPVVRGAAAPGFELALLQMGVDATDAQQGEGSRVMSGSAESTLSLSSYAGRIVLVNFWATWCEPCEREMPAMERLYQALPRDQFELIAVAIDGKEADVRAFQDRYRLSFPIVLDLDQSVYGSYQTMGVPESLLIDRDGNIVERYVGPREWDAVEYLERIRDLIGQERAVPSPGSF